MSFSYLLLLFVFALFDFGAHRPLGIGIEFEGLDLLLQRLEDDEERGDQEQQGERTDDHAAHDARAERRVAVGADAAGQHQRNHAEDHGEHRHEDGAQTHLGGRDGRPA